MFLQINISHSDHPIEEFMALEDEFVKMVGSRLLEKELL